MGGRSAQMYPGSAQGRPVNKLPRAYSNSVSATASNAAHSTEVRACRCQTAQNASAQNRPKKIGKATIPSGSSQAKRSGSTRKACPIQCRPVTK